MSGTTSERFIRSEDDVKQRMVLPLKVSDGGTGVGDNTSITAGDGQDFPWVQGLTIKVDGNGPHDVTCTVLVAIMDMLLVPRKLVLNDIRFGPMTYELDAVSQYRLSAAEHEFNAWSKQQEGE